MVSSTARSLRAGFFYPLFFQGHKQDIIFSSPLSMYGNRRQTIVKIRYERFPKGTLVGMATTTQHVPNSSLPSMLNFNQFLFFEFREVEKLYVGQDASRLDMLVLGILNLGKRIEEVLKPTITYI